VQERLDASAAEVGGGTPEKFSQFIAGEIAKWQRVVKDPAVKLESRGAASAKGQ